MIYPKFSIIIPLYVYNARFLKDLQKYSDLEYPNYEILVISDKKVDLPKIKNLSLVLTKLRRSGPAEKRDIALFKAKGEYCAFIDDDAYPDSNWLKYALKNFSDSRVAAVGGPGVTPPEDNYWQQITGLIYSSYFCGGKARHRFIPENIRFVVDFPAYNLIVRKSVLKKVGGYGNYFYGGEDTFLCLKIIKAGFRILYDPEVIVYHHRRSFIIPYLKQIGNVGIHRGYFAKKFPETSRMYFYFIPSVLALGFLGSFILSLFSQTIRIFFTTFLTLFYLLAFFSVYPKNNFDKSLAASFGIISTHLVYGLAFIKGLFTKNLKK